MEKNSFYITTTIPYVNADPHIGFALEVVQADTFARYQRLLGNDVFFNQGADEHGQKIWEKVKESGKDPQAYVDEYASKVRALKETLNLSNDVFVRTTDPRHKAAAQELWKRCNDSGDIEKRKFKGLYCVGCEKFLTERDLENGKCTLHPNLEPVELEEENYFFKLSKYQKYLEEYLSRGDVIVPKHRLEEARQFVKNGLEDFSISREKEKLPWGVPVPGDDTQVMYVWFDALTNYISTLDWPEDGEGKYKQYWEDGKKIQMAGKDQVRFQSIMWPAMLKSAGLPAPDQIFYHGFITSGGHRMSKSLGNVIAPKELVDRYGVDATRYLLLRHVHPTDDTDITWERLDEWYTAHLVNGLGNLTARIMKLAESHLDGPVDISCVDVEGWNDPRSRPYVDAYMNFEFNKVGDLIWEYVGETDEIIQEKKPFELIKVDPSQAKKDLQELVGRLGVMAFHAEPMLPETVKKIREAIKANKKPENLFPRLIV